MNHNQSTSLIKLTRIGAFMLLKARTDFVVTLDCREDLARTPDLPACSDLDLTYRRPPCKLREQADTMALNAVAALSGDEVINGNAKD